jgi:hypothetical protein
MSEVGEIQRSEFGVRRSAKPREQKTEGSYYSGVQGARRELPEDRARMTSEE